MKGHALLARNCPTASFYVSAGDSNFRCSEPAAEVRGINVHATQRVDGRDRAQIERLCRYITRVIGLKIGRSAAAVQSKASEKGVSLKPTNQSPYNRRGR